MSCDVSVGARLRDDQQRRGQDRFGCTDDAVAAGRCAALLLVLQLQAAQTCQWIGTAPEQSHAHGGKQLLPQNHPLPSAASGANVYYAVSLTSRHTEALIHKAIGSSYHQNVVQARSRNSDTPICALQHRVHDVRCTMCVATNTTLH